MKDKPETKPRPRKEEKAKAGGLYIIEPNKTKEVKKNVDAS